MSLIKTNNFFFYIKVNATSLFTFTNIWISVFLSAVFTFFPFTLFHVMPLFPFYFPLTNTFGSLSISCEQEISKRNSTTKTFVVSYNLQWKSLFLSVWVVVQIFHLYFNFVAGTFVQYCRILITVLKKIYWPCHGSANLYEIYFFIF